MAKNGAAAGGGATNEKTKKTVTELKLAPVDPASMPSMNIQRSCGGCEHYDPVPKNPRIGLCVENSPQVVPVVSLLSQKPSPDPNAPPMTVLYMQNVDGFFPPTRWDLRCGRFSPRPGGPVPKDPPPATAAGNA